MDWLDSNLNMVERLLKKHLCMLKAVDDARQSGDWSEVAALADFCRRDLRLTMIENIKQQLDSPDKLHDTAALQFLLAQLENAENGGDPAE